MPIMSKDTQEAYDNLKLDVTTLHVAWLHVFRPLYAVEESLTVLNKAAPNTFSLFQWALLDHVCLALTRLSDPPKYNKKDRMCLAYLISTLDSKTDDSLIKTVKTQLESFKQKCQPFRERRDLWIAHKDLETAQNIAIAPPSSFSRAQVEEALKELRLFMNEVQGYYENAETAYDQAFIADDGKTVINLLKRGLEAQELEIAAFSKSLEKNTS